MRVLSFNILAPSARLCMPLRTVEWKERQRAVIATIKKLNPDVICLQEYDFVTPGFHEMYQEAFDTNYSIFTKRRPGGKPEGLAMFIRRMMFTEIEVTSEVLPPHYAKRIIQIVTAKYKKNQRIIIGNTHLTVASSSNHYDIPTTRPMQAKRVLELIKETTATSATNHDAIILCGDFNSDYLEKENPKQVVGFPAYTIEQASQPIYQIFQDGYLSAFHTLHPSQRPISHTCSYAQDGNTDYIFYKSMNHTIIPKEAYLYPKEVPSDKVWNEQTGWDDDTNNNDKLDLMITSSDHRPLMTVFEFNNNNNNERLKKIHTSSPLKKKHKTADKLYNEEKKIDQEEKRQLYKRPDVPCLPC